MLSSLESSEEGKRILLLAQREIFFAGAFLGDLHVTELGQDRLEARVDGLPGFASHCRYASRIRNCGRAVLAMPQHLGQLWKHESRRFDRASRVTIARPALVRPSAQIA